ncbi:MAG TPA: DNA repair protein RadC, partial [bacterium]|nr:DNA repair protein RadC [bacterium]
LSDAELIALLLRNGVRGKDALGLARELLAEFGGIRGLFAVESKRLKTVKGLGPAKISSLLAVSEIGRRRLREEITGKPFLRDPQTVMSYLYASLRDKKKEVFKVLFLNKANCVVNDQDLFEGTLDETAVHLREIIKASLDHHASALILVHNHPSGRIEPSREDIEITRKIQNACQSVGIRILDHLIVGDNQYYSFSEQHLL